MLFIIPEYVFNILIYSWIALAISIFILLFKVTAPFGRHTTTSWGLSINNRWAWFLMEIPSLVGILFFFWLGNSAFNPVALFILGHWAFHYFNRSFIYPLRQRDTQKKMPILIVLSAVFFNGMNSFFNGYYLGNWSEGFTTAWLLDIRFILGFLLFWAGLIINWSADNRLLHLRKPGETHYKIPQGWLFRWISCPNLFGEIIEWLGFALMVSHPAAWSFAIWTAANLIPRAHSHHLWYLQKFPDYPKERKAVFPYIF